MIKEFLTFKGVKNNKLMFEDFQGKLRGFVEFEKKQADEFGLLENKNIDKTFYVKYFSKNKVGEKVNILKEITFVHKTGKSA